MGQQTSTKIWLTRRIGIDNNRALKLDLEYKIEVYRETERPLEIKYEVRIGMSLIHIGQKET
jgi:hypothetical protein